MAGRAIIAVQGRGGETSRLSMCEGNEGPGTTIRHGLRILTKRVNGKNMGEQLKQPGDQTKTGAKESARGRQGNTAKK